MKKETMLRIAKEEEHRFKALKDRCDMCIPDELIEWIEAVIELIEESK